MSQGFRVLSLYTVGGLFVLATEIARGRKGLLT